MMQVRLAACEPCRRSKLSCGHERPVCNRCSRRGQSGSCTYRARPFKRRSSRAPVTRSSGVDSPTSSPAAFQTTDPSPTEATRYPNPGYLGSFSHSGMLAEISSSHVNTNVETAGAGSQEHLSPTSGETLVEGQDILDRASNCVGLLHQLEFSHLSRLVTSWLEKGVNLNLAEPFIAACNDAASSLGPSVQAAAGHPLQARTLLLNSRRPIIFSGDSCLSEYVAQMAADSLRWETIGLFLAAASRAVLDTPSFSPVYLNEDQRMPLVRNLTKMCDSCLEIALALDCLNDLQFVLQYENFMIQTHVNGDQSYSSWRRFGDLTSSLYALGLHEKVDEDSLPGFMAELRKACFARIYSLDKDLAIFLGRPPRISKDYCHFQVPTRNVTNSVCPAHWSLSRDLRHDQDTGGTFQLSQSCRETCPSYTAEIRCRATFAVFKEQILRAFCRHTARPDTHRTMPTISEVEGLWDELAPSFKLEGRLRDSQSSPFVRDFLASIRLDYLHLLLLLNLAYQPSKHTYTESTLHVASQILSLVIEVVAARDSLINSGTSLTWKIALYGLPAAAICSLALLVSHSSFQSNPQLRSQVIQHLNVLVVDIRLGTWIQRGNPNFALFTQATQTIQSLLDSIGTGKGGSVNSAELPSITESWTDLPGDFEIEFWTGLADQINLGQHTDGSRY